MYKVEYKYMYKVLMLNLDRGLSERCAVDKTKHQKQVDCFGTLLDLGDTACFGRNFTGVNEVSMYVGQMVALLVCYDWHALSLVWEFYHLKHGPSRFNMGLSPKG